MDDWVRQCTKQMADSIREKLKNGMLFGRTINLDDVDSILVCAYELGKTEERGERIKEREFERLLYEKLGGAR